jgi:hypothetical protein
MGGGGKESREAAPALPHRATYLREADFTCLEGRKPVEALVGVLRGDYTNAMTPASTF